MEIRPQQMDAFEQAAIKDFEDRMVVQLTRFFSEKCETLGDEEVRRIVQTGIQKSRQYGMQNESDVCLYVGLMFSLGLDFDNDPRLPWATRILNAQDSVLKDKKAERLHQAASQFFLSATRSASRS